MRKISALIDFLDFEKLFLQGNMAVSKAQYERFCTYAELLKSRNEQMNLTAITDPEGIAVKHFFDSVYPFTLIDVPRGTRLIDVGTGAGFPSVALKIMREDVEITLLDSLNKRVNFLRELTEKLGMEVTCYHSRAEEAAKTGQPLREAFDMATARAVARLSELCEYCLPFVRVGGYFAALKGDCDAEISESQNAVKTLGGEIEDIIKYELPNGDKRRLVLIKKITATPDKYPRASARIKKQPL